LTSNEQAAVRRVLLRLATGEPGILVRRRCPYAEAAYDEPSRRVVDALAAARLITVEAATVEVAHEALFDNWPRLANWLDEDEHGRRLRAHLAPAALAWDESGRPEADLYRGVRLDAAVDWAREHPTHLTPAERDFLTASVSAAEQELQAERARTAHEARAGRRLRVLLTAVAGAAAVAVAATIVAVGQRSTATEQARLATARELGAAALINQPLDHSLLLAASAVRINNNLNTRSDLLAALQRSPAAQPRMAWRRLSPLPAGAIRSRPDHGGGRPQRHLDVEPRRPPDRHRDAVVPQQCPPTGRGAARHRRDGDRQRHQG
jgi:hypothetical protein